MTPAVEQPYHSETVASTVILDDEIAVPFDEIDGLIAKFRHEQAVKFHLVELCR